MTDKQYEKGLEIARKLGADNGANAAVWWEQDAIGGRAMSDVRETARRVLQGLDDCDPEIYDSLPYPDLSGEWADSFTSGDLVLNIGDELGENVEPEVGSEFCDAYCDAFNEACEAAIVTCCKAVLA